LTKRVIIIGGGFSGLAAGVALSQSGAQVTLLERRSYLGGRAYSFIDGKTGDVVDNGQHLFMACYHQTIAFLDLIGCRDLVKFQSSARVDFLDREHGFTALACPELPAPLHVLVGLLRMKGLSLGDKLGTFKLATALRPGTNGDAGKTVSQWLSGLGQSERIKERFWYPMAIATLNEDPAVASAKMLKRVLELGFGGSRADSAIGLSRVGLSDLYVHAAKEFIESRGGSVRTGTGVRRLNIEQGKVMSCETERAEMLEADCFISAVPPQAFLRMLPEECRNGEFGRVAELGSSPIVSMNLWFDRPVIEREFVGLLGTNIQWLFNKDVICKPGKRSNHIALVISAARRYTSWTKERLIEMATGELRELLPESRNAQVIHSRIVKEHEATLAHTVESDSLRPGARTGTGNLLLAGDWTNTGLPATIESAVVSGNLAAEAAGAI
jgi:squalene-associated FAD-dependent desaturase